MAFLVSKMKAANRNNNMRDDVYLNRLFSYFQSQFHDNIKEFVPIRGHVFLVKTDKQAYILKGYHSNRRLKLQEAFTETLRKEGFVKTYRFLSPPAKGPLFFEGDYFGCINYIPPNKTPFSYQHDRNRREGLDLLEEFHNTTQSFETRYQTLLSKADLFGKWKERHQLFLNNLPFIRYFINEPFVSEMISWAQWSLSQMEQHFTFFQKEPPVIVHGDVAHHNFLRDRLGRLYLIDFDLISIGPPSLDYLQYANRILPYLDWSFEKLFIYGQMKKYVHEPGFLAALVYPADIFREWNRILREKSYTSQEKLKPVMDLSISQFYERKKFAQQIKGILE